MPSQTDDFIRNTLHLAGPFSFLIRPLLTPIIGLEYLAGVQYHDDTPDVHYQQSPGASSSSDPAPSGASSSGVSLPSVVGAGLHRYLTLEDIARLRATSHDVQQEINQHGGEAYVQSLVSTDITQLSPVILHGLFLMGHPIFASYSGAEIATLLGDDMSACLNQLSDSVFQDFMNQHALRAHDVVDLDRHHIGLLTRQQFYGIFINTIPHRNTRDIGSHSAELNSISTVVYLLNDEIPSANAGTSIFSPEQLSTLAMNFLLMHEIYYQTHQLSPADGLLLHVRLADDLRLSNLISPQTYREHIRPRDGLRRLAVIKEDAADNEMTSQNLDANQFVEYQDFLQTQLETSSDHDWIRMLLFKGSTYTFRMNNLGGDLDSYLTLRDAQGNQVTYNDDSDGGLNSRIIFTAEKSGAYYLDASSYASRSSGSYEISSSLVDITALAVNSQYATALTSAKKNQLFKIDLKAGQRYEFLMNKESTDPNFDAYLYLRDANKNVITRDDDSGGSLNSKISYTASSDGVYYLDASSWQQKSVGKYTIVSHHII